MSLDHDATRAPTPPSATTAATIPTATVTRSTPPITPTPPATVLVVDDNAANRDALSRRLERRGYAVATAEDGPGALHLLAQRPFDLVLLDVMMPGMSG